MKGSRLQCVCMCVYDLNSDIVLQYFRCEILVLPVTASLAESRDDSGATSCVAINTDEVLPRKHI